MEDKKALRILCECANGEKKLLFSDSLDLERIISKRLEKLEKLEKENKKLKEENRKLKLNLEASAVIKNRFLEEIECLTKENNNENC